VRIVQVGMGIFGRNWATTIFPQVPEARLVACVDLRPDALAETVRLGITESDRCYEALSRALESVDADAVLVTTDPSTHVATTRQALEAGKAVLSEKPFATTVAEGEQLVEMADRLGLLVMVSQNYRFYPAVRYVQGLVAEGSLGPLVHVAVDFRVDVGGEKSKAHHAWVEPLLADMSVHHFDLMRAVTGREPVSVQCRSWRAPWSGFEGTIEAIATIVLTGDVPVSYRASLVCPAKPTLWAGEWRMEFEEGEVWWTSRDNGSTSKEDAASVYRYEGSHAESRVELPKVPFIDRAGSLAAFVGSFVEGRVPETSGRDNLATLALTYGAIESAALREQVNFG
jgi:predicted dehydrogenase